MSGCEPARSCETVSKYSGAAIGIEATAGGNSRSRTVESTRSDGAYPPVCGLVESRGPEPRKPGERSAKRERGSLSAAMRSLSPAALKAGSPNSVTAASNRIAINGASESARFHRMSTSQYCNRAAARPKTRRKPEPKMNAPLDKR